MASLPPRQQPQRRTSPEQSTADQSQPAAQPTPIRTRSAHSEDSQTLFLNSPQESSPHQQQTPTQDQQPRDPTRARSNTNEIKKCWICFADSTEDTAETSPWRNPCPCALVAHEECLLDWIADIEAPNRNRSRSIQAPRIECPQCKSEIKLSRPRDLVVDAVRGLQRVTAQLTTPGALTLLMGTLYNESMLFGVHSIYAVFGSADGVRILRPLLYNIVRSPVEFGPGASAGEAGQKALRIFLDHVVHWRLYAGIPLIGPVLVLSRTTLADSILPVLPVLFFATQMHSPEEVLEFGVWPPSASLAFAVLPYVRQAYNAGYKRLFAEREKRWLREIQPRVGQGQGADGAEGGRAAGEGGQAGGVDGEREDDNMFEVRIDGGIWEEWEGEDEGMPELEEAQDAAQPPRQQDRNPGPQAQERPDGQADPPPDIQDNRGNDANAHPIPDALPAAPQQQAQPQPQAQQQQPNGANPNAGQQPQAERRLSFSPTSIASSVLGALIFPSLAGMSGELLKLLLPATWTTAPVLAPKFGLGGRGGRVATGLLQEKWGRSLVGGCAFVVVKDAVMLYVRWRMARIQGERRVVEYRGEGRDR